MNALDVLILASLIWGMRSGWRRGFANSLCHTGAAVVALVLATRYTLPLSEMVAVRLSLSPALARASVFLLLLIGVAALGYAATPYVSRFMHSVRPDFDRWVGSVLGAAQGLLIATMLVIFCARLPWAAAQAAVGGSSLALHMVRAAPALYEVVRSVVPGNVPLF